jgi:hypothetical protein
MEEQTNTQTEAQESLVLADVILMHNIIATVSRRGAFEAAEMEIVGKLFNKLKAFIPKTDEQQEGAETSNTSEEVDDGQTQFEFVQDEAAAQ